MTALIICAVVWIAPLLAGDGVSSDMKKCPPARLRALISDRYEASLCAARNMLLA